MYQQQDLDLLEGNLNSKMHLASQLGEEDLVRLLLEKGADDYNTCMSCAGYWGHVGIVKLMLEKGATNVNLVMINAAHFGRIEILKLMLEHSLEYNEAMKNGLEYNEEMKNNLQYNEAMRMAAMGGQIEAIRLLLDCGANNYNEALDAAIRCRDTDGEVYGEIVLLLLERGATDYNSALIFAAEYGHESIVFLALEKGATDYDSAIKYAKGYGPIVVRGGSSSRSRNPGWNTLSPKMQDIINLLTLYKAGKVKL